MHFGKNNWILLILAGSLFWSVTMVKSGLVYPFGAGFWGPNGHDGVWHISLAESLTRGSWSMPIFPSEPVRNYHIGFDLLLSTLHIFTSLPLSVLYFQILPPLFAVFSGILLYYLTRVWGRSRSFSGWSLFFYYFGGGFGWVWSMYTTGQPGGESLFWSQQSGSTLINPPYALSLLMLFLALILLTKRHFWLSILFLSLLPQIKVYAGVIAFAGLFAAGLKDRWFWKVGVVSILGSALIFLPVNLGSAGLLTFQPLWFLDHLMTPDRLDWPRFQSALSTYRSGLIWPKLISAYLFLLVLFLVGNLGPRIIGIFHIRSVKRWNWWEVFLWSGSLTGLVLTMLFLQKGTAWNTIQFFYYTQVFFGLLTARFLSVWPKGQVARIGVGILIIVFTLPVSFSLLPHYLPKRPPAKITHEELAALAYLKTLPPGTVLTNPFDKKAADEAQAHPPRSLYEYESTAYVSAYSGHDVFFEDEVNLNITGYSWQKRRSEVERFFSQPDARFLTENRISYLYLLTDRKTDINPALLQLTPLFSNSKVLIYAAGK